MNYQATHYQGKPAVWDNAGKVMLTGFRTMQEARERANTLNNPQQENRDASPSLL